MDLSFWQWSTLVIGIGSLVVVWLWSAIGDWFLQHWRFLCHARKMEGPSALPIIGNAHWFIGSPDDVLRQLTVLSKPFTTSFRIWFGPRLWIAVTNPSDIEIVMNHSKATYKPSEYRFTEAFFGRGLITSSGPTHRIHRNLIMPMVNGKTLDLYMDSFDTQSRRCAECLESMIDKGEFEIMPFMDNFTVDIIMDTIIDCPALAQKQGYSELIDCIIKLFNLSYERTMKVWLHPDCIYFRTRRGKQHQKAIAVVNKFMDDIVAERKKKYYDSETDYGLSNLSTLVLLDRLLTYNEENKLMDDIRLRDEVFTVFVAVIRYESFVKCSVDVKKIKDSEVYGDPNLRTLACKAQDPTALLCSFTLMMLGMHPEIQDKVRNEVEELVGDANLTVNNVSKLKYLSMVIKETLRLFPVGSILLREAQEDIDLETCTVPKGCTIGMFLFMTCRDPRFWNEPEKFDPERFSPENSVGRHPYAFVPFSSGFRGCIGRQYAMTLVKSLLVRVVQKYRLHCNRSLENLKLTTNISVRSLDGYKVSITRL